MLEKFFGQKSEAQKVRELSKIAANEFRIGVNGPAMYMAFQAMQEKNKEGGYGFTNNFLLNLVRDCAFGNATEIENSMMGGRGQVEANINYEIENLRQGLSPEERGR